MKTISFLITCLIASHLSAQWTPIDLQAGPPLTGVITPIFGTQQNRFWLRYNHLGYVSDDQGLNWRRWQLPNGAEARLLHVGNSLVLALSDEVAGAGGAMTSTLYQSADNGDSWQAVFTDSTQQFQIQTLCEWSGSVFFTVPDPLWSGRKKLYRCDGTSGNINEIIVAAPLMLDLALDNIHASPQYLLADMYIDDGICDPGEIQLKSADGGATWVRTVPHSAHHFQISGMHWLAEDFLGQNTRLWSVDEGTSLQQIPEAYPTYGSYAFNPGSDLWYFKDRHLFRLNWNTRKWVELPDCPSYIWQIEQSAGGTVLATGYDGTIWRYAAGISTATDEAAMEAAAWKLFPNPGGDRIDLQWQGEKTPELPLEVYDQQGRLYLQTEEKIARQTSIDVRQWPAGLYRLVIGRQTLVFVKI